MAFMGQKSANQRGLRRELQGDLLASLTSFTDTTLCVCAAPFLAVWGAVQGDANIPVKPQLAYAGMHNTDISLQI